MVSRTELSTQLLKRPGKRFRAHDRILQGRQSTGLSIVPAKEFVGWLDSFWRTGLEDRFYWHVRIVGATAKLTMDTRAGIKPIDVTQCLIKWGAQSENPNGIPSQSPRLPHRGYLGSPSIQHPQPQRSFGQSLHHVTHTVRRNLVEVVFIIRRSPKVGVARQPWAEVNPYDFTPGLSWILRRSWRRQPFNGSYR